MVVNSTGPSESKGHQLDVVVNSTGSAESKDHHLDHLGVVINSAGPTESKGHQLLSAVSSQVITNGLKPMAVGNGAVAANPPDVVSDTLRQKPVPTSLPLDTWNRDGWAESERGKQRTKVNGGHSRMRQKSIHCLETAV